MRDQGKQHATLRLGHQAVRGEALEPAHLAGHLGSLLDHVPDQVGRRRRCRPAVDAGAIHAEQPRHVWHEGKLGQLIGPDPRRAVGRAVGLVPKRAADDATVEDQPILVAVHVREPLHVGDDVPHALDLHPESGLLRHLPAGGVGRILAVNTPPPGRNQRPSLCDRADARTSSTRSASSRQRPYAAIRRTRCTRCLPSTRPLPTVVTDGTGIARLGRDGGPAQRVGRDPVIARSARSAGSVENADQRRLNVFRMLIMPGPSTTMNNAGKRQKINGNRIFTGTF